MKQEPVAWINVEERKFEWNGPVLWETPTVAVLDKIPLYTHPKREWAGLTDEEQEEIYKKHSMDGWGLFYDAIEAKLKERNT